VKKAFLDDFVATFMMLKYLINGIQEIPDEDFLFIFLSNNPSEYDQIQ
jgi:hypothetical protein